MLNWPIHVINLDRSVTRRDAIEQEMLRLDFPFRRFSAIDGAELDRARFSGYPAQPEGAIIKKPLTRAEIACYLSHIAVWKEIAEGEHPAAFVFEDDATFREDAAGVMTEIARRTPDWDILKLYSDKTKNLFDREFLGSKYCYGVARILPMSTIGYAITKPAAAYMAERACRFSLPVDMDMKQWWNHQACVKIVQPSLCQPSEALQTSSEINQDRERLWAGGDVSRFVRNMRYQSATKWAVFRHSHMQRRRASWPVAAHAEGRRALDEGR